MKMAFGPNKFWHVVLSDRINSSILKMPTLALIDQYRVIRVTYILTQTQLVHDLIHKQGFTARINHNLLFTFFPELFFNSFRSVIKREEKTQIINSVQYHQLYNELTTDQPRLCQRLFQFKPMAGKDCAICEISHFGKFGRLNETFNLLTRNK